MAITTLYLGSNAYTTEDKIYLGDTLVWTASTLADGLVSRYNFNESSGNLLDQVGSNDGTVVGATQNGSEYSFAVNDYVETGTTADFDFGTGNWSISIWINSTVSSNGGVFGYGDRNSTKGITALSLSSTGKFRIIIDDGTTQLFTDSITTVNNTGWHLVTITYTNGGNCLIYIDGSLDQTLDVSTLGSLTATSQNKLVLGNYYFGAALSTNYFNGSLDNLRIYNRALSGAEVTEIYNLGRS